MPGIGLNKFLFDLYEGNPPSSLCLGSMKNFSIITRTQLMAQSLYDYESNEKYIARWNRKIMAKFAQNCRLRLYQAIKNNKRSDSSFNLIGCSIRELKTYITKQFKKGMTWDNYGLRGWHIDHIIPCDSFDLSNPNEQRKCFHYSNLQPLWAKDNLSKGKIR